MEPPPAGGSQKKNGFIMAEKNLDHFRHSCAHLMAAAVLQLWPETKNAIGPAIENGFYTDFDFGKRKISETDFPAIEKKMKEILASWGPFQTKEVTVEEARKDFAWNPYKLELIEEFAKEGKTLTENNPGNFLDLCRGGHVAHPKSDLKHFKLLSIAGAYWRGDEKNKMLTRIYGTCFPTKTALDQFLFQQEEAKKRDHRKIGKEQELFLISQSVGGGFPLYMPHGFLLRRALEQWLTKEKEKRGFQFVWTPHVGKSDLYRQSGHWQKYDAMFNPMKLDDDEYVVKPMNCPHHFQIYLERPRSYRELPLRIAENATVYRNEKAGELNGLLRVRSLTQDDSHIFVRHSQIAEEIDRLLELTTMVFRRFGFDQYRARISSWDPQHKEKYLGKAENWEMAQDALIGAVDKRNIPRFIGVGEAAFYGPKIDVMARDAIGREWQLTTIQLDFNQPENFNMNFINEEGREERPAVLHVAILGSFDRFLAILIEHYAGKFPVWLSPVQIAVIPIADRHIAQARIVAEFLKNGDIRAQVDDRSESMQAKIRDATLQKIPYMGIIGDTEVKNGSRRELTVRTREGENIGTFTAEEFLHRLQKEIEYSI